MLAATEMDRLVTFRGTSKDTVTPEAWAEQVDRHISVLKWTSAQTAGAAIQAMRDEANIWRETLKHNVDKKAMLTDWTLMRPAFIKRFGKHRTRASKIHGFGTLKQGPAESCNSYNDRVIHAMDKLLADEMEALEGENRKAGFKAARDIVETAVFMCGMKPELKPQVEMALNDEDGLDQVKKIALKAEIALSTRQANLKIAAIDTHGSETMRAVKGELQEIKAVVKAITSGSNETVAAMRDKRNKAKTTKKMPAMGDRTHAILCWKCKQWGRHTQGECKLDSEQIARLVPQTKDDKPSGTNIYDAQFPNA
jgi:hypothetical protein